MLNVTISMLRERCYWAPRKATLISHRLSAGMNDIYIYIYTYIYTHIIYKKVCIYVCMRIYIYIYIYTHDVCVSKARLSHRPELITHVACPWGLSSRDEQTDA